MASFAASVGPDGILLVDTIYHGAEEHVLEEIHRLGGVDEGREWVSALYELMANASD